MECNKDEAARAKGIAEKKLLERDFSGAEKFALKAQCLFPKLDGLSQFLEIIHVNVVHEKKINGEANYYGVLGVHPFADEVAMKKQYKKMAVSLHPDKNRSAGADDAFKILSQAWNVLSDKDKRSLYDLKINKRASIETQPKYNTTAPNPQPKKTNESQEKAWSSPGVERGNGNQASNFSSSNAKPNTKHSPTQQKTPETVKGQTYAYSQTPAAATTFGPRYNPATCKPFSDLNKENPVKKRRTDVHKCATADKGSQGTVGNRTGVTKGSASLKRNVSSSAKYTSSATVPNPQPRNTAKSQGATRSSPGVERGNGMRNQAANFNSSNATQRSPTRQKTPVTVTGQSYVNVQTPAAATFGPQYNPTTCKHFSGLNKENPVKKRRTDVRKCATADKGSQGTGVNMGSASLKGNLSSSAKHTSSATFPKLQPTRPKTPGKECYDIKHGRKNSTISGTNYKHVPSRVQTPSASTVRGLKSEKLVREYANLKGNPVMRKHNVGH